MSHVTGRFSVDVQFTDSTASAGVQSLKTISLQHATEYDFGKVALVAGTCGTAAVTVPLSPTGYRNSAGEVVSLANVSRVAFAAYSPGLVKVAGSGDWHLYSRAGQVAASEAFETTSFSVATTAGTAAFTLVLYGS